MFLFDPLERFFPGKETQPVVKGRQIEFLSTNVSEHNVGGLPREQAAKNV